jgi:CHAT domain-containing protein
VNNRLGEARLLLDIGNVYLNLRDGQKALDYQNQALEIYRQMDFGFGEADALNNIGASYGILGEYQKALDYYNQALPIYRQGNIRRGEANTLNNIGNMYAKLGDQKSALDSYNQALAQAAIVNDPLLESRILIQLMLNQKASQPNLAVFYGKQAINLLQQVRGNIQGLDEDVQKSFLNSKKSYYHALADLLIAQGRLPEAEQVLDLEKQQEYSDYLHGQPADTLSPLAITPAERQAEEEYQKSTTALVSVGEQWAQLKKNTTRTPEQEKQFQELSDQLAQANKGLDVFYSRLYALFGKTSSANNQVRDVKGPVSDLKQIIAQMPHTVALYTLVGTDRTSIIVIAGSEGVPPVVRESAISEVELNKKVAAFQEVLRQPGQDPKPLAQELYNILIGPVKADLDQAKAETLVWSLDGVLRYVPMAALYDGKQYVVENFSTVTITPTSIAHLAEQPDMTNISTVAMGISQKYEEGLPALPAVAGELDDVVKDAKVQGANGALAGTILLNGQFTEKAMENQLGGHPTVVHIASHFVYSPTGDASKSYLLLAGKDQGGEPFHLTVEDFRDDVNLSLSKTALLTLSACDTGMSGNASDGKEVDGLGMTAEDKGAKAVISSLWSVNDASTGQLMGDFYKRWADGAGKVEKVEALRQAQLDLLLGKARVQGDGSNRGVEPEGPAPAGYAHPYYWAAFVLMGNWR